MRFSRMAGGIVLIVASVTLAQEPAPSTYSLAIPQSLHGPFISDPARHAAPSAGGARRASSPPLCRQRSGSGPAVKISG